MRAVIRGLSRMDAKVQEVEDLVDRRKRKGGFEVQYVLAFCWPSDKSNLEAFFVNIVRFRSSTRTFTLYLYDLCYALFPPGSPAYDLRNELEVKLDGQLRPLAGGTSLPPEHLPQGPPPGVLSDLSRCFGRTVVVPFHTEIPMAAIAMIMRHVAFHYDRLPDLMFFLHADAHEHIQADAIHTVFKSAALMQWPPETSFLMLGHRHNNPEDASGRMDSEVRSYCEVRQDLDESVASRSWRGHWSPFRGGSHLVRSTSRTPSGAYCQWLELAWELLFGRPFRLPEDDYGGYDFGQLAVAREAARSRPREFWQRAWRAMCTRSNYELLPGTHFVSFRVDLSGEHGKNAWSGFHKPMECIFEHLWHVIFNPEAKSWLWPTRLRDPTLPLSFKFRISEHNFKLLQGYQWTAHDPL